MAGRYKKVVDLGKLRVRRMDRWNYVFSTVNKPRHHMSGVEQG